MDDNLTKKTDTVLNLLTDAYYSSKTFHDILFKDAFDERKQIKSAIFLNKAISLMASAKAIYVSDYENLEKYDIDQIFISFNEFEDEFLECFATDHPHQWTDIQFNRYEESIKPFLKW